MRADSENNKPFRVNTSQTKFNVFLSLKKDPNNWKSLLKPTDLCLDFTDKIKFLHTKYSAC